MYNLPKFDSEKAAKNLSKTYQSRYVQNWRALLGSKNVVEGFKREGRLAHTL